MHSLSNHELQVRRAPQQLAAGATDAVACCDWPTQDATRVPMASIHAASTAHEAAFTRLSRANCVRYIPRSAIHWDASTPEFPLNPSQIGTNIR
jgi:hypothetical protein